MIIKRVRDFFYGTIIVEQLYILCVIINYLRVVKNISRSKSISNL